MHRNNFDLIRLVAASQVMLSHMLSWLQPGYPPNEIMRLIGLFSGVPIFFIVSGFLISATFLNSNRGTVAYFRNRALRIYPALWFNLVGIICLLHWGGNLALSISSPEFWRWCLVAFFSASDIIANDVTGTPIFGPGLFMVFPSGVLATIPIEICFYLLVPIIFAFRDRLGTSLLLFGAVSLLFFAFDPVTASPYAIGRYLWFFLMGAALQIYWPRIRRFIEGKAGFWLLAYVGGVYLALLGGHQYNYRLFAVENVVLNAVLACFVISCAHTLPTVASRLLHRQDISYGVFLWHMPVVWTMVAKGMAGSWSYALLAMAITAAIASISWRFVEAPALAYGKAQKRVKGLA